MTLWTEKQRKTISERCRDFNVSNYKTKMTEAGGFDKYVRSLGISMPTKVRTVSEFRQSVQYIMALMAIWGIDYNNGKVYYRWGNGSSDAFRTSGKGKCRGGNLRTILDDPAVVTTNCNYGVNLLLKEMGLYRCASENYKAWATSYGKTVTKKRDLRPGDMVHFFARSVDRSKPSTWSTGAWKHVAIVYAVEDGKVWLADFGSRFVKSKEPLHYMPINDSPMAGGEYGTRYWTAVHAFDLEDDMKTVDDRAVELRRDIESYLAAKKAEYGEEVYTMAQGYQVNREAYLRAAADYVLNGYAGSGEARKVFFGEDYADVQEKVNWVIKMAEDVIIGKYGSGDVRKAALGDDYYVVQAQVNRILGRGWYGIHCRSFRAQHSDGLGGSRQRP